MEASKRLGSGVNAAETAGSGVVKKKTVQIGIAKMCNSAPENRKMMLDNNGWISFTPKSTCLGSNTDFMLDGTEDVKSKIDKASKSMGVLKLVWDEKDVPLETKIKLCTNIPMSLSLWGGDNWSGNKHDTRRIEPFQNKAMRRMLGIDIAQAKEEERTND